VRWTCRRRRDVVRCTCRWMDAEVDEMGEDEYAGVVGCRRPSTSPYNAALRSSTWGEEAKQQASAGGLRTLRKEPTLFFSIYTSPSSTHSLPGRTHRRPSSNLAKTRRRQEFHVSLFLPFSHPSCPAAGGTHRRPIGSHSVMGGPGTTRKRQAFSGQVGRSTRTNALCLADWCLYQTTHNPPNQTPKVASPWLPEFQQH
jgi:hypothetical protein